MSTPRECVRADCPGKPGVIQETGFCDACLRRPLRARPEQAPGGPGAPAGAPAEGSAADGPHGPAVKEPLDRDGLVVLPYVVVGDVAKAATPEARLPSGGRACPTAGCDGRIGIGYGGRPPAEEGFCVDCGRRYTFRPRLRPSDRVGEHYEVLGYLTPGGFGWVYLARDVHNPEQRVVLKTMIDPSDEAARTIAEAERHLLTTLRHSDIVRIITFEHHRGEQDAEPVDYLVMEYVGGRSLREIVDASDTELRALFGGPLDIGHVITYGCKILGAFEYLHQLGWLYCDMKPDNVIHYEREIKIIDLGGVRRTEDHESRLVYDERYAPPAAERHSRGFHTDSDLYTVGRTLAHLAERALPAKALAARSFGHLVARATHMRPEARFTSAAQMSRQLWEVLREHRALLYNEEFPERSTLFAPTAELFGADLGSVLPLAHWSGRPRGSGPGGPLDVMRRFVSGGRRVPSAAGRAGSREDAAAHGAVAGRPR
ncbi:protein kinase domain-containing protein, partial [Streptomyces fuscigenes]|uniref:protein kinase domain-containing protein n=1 Tax=Streptomyces fuscigenes TaxID=1528880 RepID=UPI001F2BC610